MIAAPVVAATAAAVSPIVATAIVAGSAVVVIVMVIVVSGGVADESRGGDSCHGKPGIHGLHRIPVRIVSRHATGGGPQADDHCDPHWKLKQRGFEFHEAMNVPEWRDDKCSFGEFFEIREPGARTLSPIEATTWYRAIAGIEQDEVRCSGEVQIRLKTMECLAGQSDNLLEKVKEGT